MSQLFVDNIKNRTGGALGLPEGVIVTGVGTFSGSVSIGGTLTYEDVTNIDSVGVVTARSGINVTAGGINAVGVVTATSFSGNITGDVTGGSLVGTGLSVSGISTFSGAQKVSTGAEKVHRQSGNTVALTFNSTSSSNVGYTTNPDGNITLAVTNIPTSSDFDDHSITFAVIVNSTGTARTCTTVTLNGVSKTIRWAGGSLDNAISGVTTTTGHSIFNFTGINTVGSASTTDNYEVFGIVSGGFF